MILTIKDVNRVGDKRLFFDTPEALIRLPNRLKQKTNRSAKSADPARNTEHHCQLLWTLLVQPGLRRPGTAPYCRR
jgi:hypothetical protein